MLCWETIAEFIYEVRSGGQFSDDIVEMLVKELLFITDPQIRQEIEVMTSSDTFGNPESMIKLHAALSEIEEYASATGKIFVELLAGTRRQPRCAASSIKSSTSGTRR